MLAPRRIAGFIFRLLLFYGLLAAPWPGARQAYTAIFRAAGNLLAGAVIPDAAVGFRDMPDASRSADVRIVIEAPWSSRPHATELSSRLTGFLPVAQVAALVLATPISWSRRWRALLWTFLAVNCFVAVRVWSIVYFLYSTTSPPNLQVGQLLADMVSIVASPTPAFLVPPIAWLVCTFKKEDLQFLYPGSVGKVSQPETPGGAKHRSAARSRRKR